VEQEKFAVEAEVIVCRLVVDNAVELEVGIVDHSLFVVVGTFGIAFAVADNLIKIN
jgi:hypothetical protein